MGIESRLSSLERRAGVNSAPTDPGCPTLEQWKESRLRGEPLADFPEFEAVAAARMAQAEATMIMFEEDAA